MAGALPVCLIHELRKHVEQGDLTTEITKAIRFCRDVLSNYQAASGISASSTTIEELKEKVGKLTGQQSKGASTTSGKPKDAITSGVLFGGSLAMVDLSVYGRARPLSEIDVGRMGFIADHLTTAALFSTAIGHVAVSADCLKDELMNLVKVERDTETDMALLAIYWHREHKEHLVALAVQSQNMVFCAEKQGLVWICMCRDSSRKSSLRQSVLLKANQHTAKPWPSARWCKLLALMQLMVPPT